MCTVTFIAHRNGYALGMNRDEKLTRATALAPTLRRLCGREILFPSEPSGGTWIGLNDSGVTLALINWYSVPKSVPKEAVSRGELVKTALPTGSPSIVNRTLVEFPLAHVKPFRLIGIFPSIFKVVEWRWNLDCLNQIDHGWETNIWISSGYDEPGAQQTRGKTFSEALRHRSAGSLEWLRRLHRSHDPDCGPYSICMHRPDAATVSYTEITVSARAAKMHYALGPPCSKAKALVHGLDLYP